MNEKKNEKKGTLLIILVEIYDVSVPAGFFDYPVLSLAVSPNRKRLAWASGDLEKPRQSCEIRLRKMP